MCVPGTTKIENNKLLRYNGTTWEVMGDVPPPPRNSGPLRVPGDDEQHVPDNDGD